MIRGAGEMRYRAALTNYGVTHEGVYGGVLDSGATWTSTVWAASEPLTRAAYALASGQTPLATRRVTIDRLAEVTTSTRVVVDSVTYEVVEVLDDGLQMQLLVRERAA